MAGPPSIASSAATLLSLGLQVTQPLHKYHTIHRDRDRDLANITSQTSVPLQSIRLIDDVVRTRKWQADEQEDIKHIKQTIICCGEIIQKTRDYFQKFKKETTRQPKADCNRRRTMCSLPVLTKHTRENQWGNGRGETWRFSSCYRAEAVRIVQGSEYSTTLHGQLKQIEKGERCRTARKKAHSPAKLRLCPRLNPCKML